MGPKATWVTATPGATPVCTPENVESPSRFFLERAPRSRWLFSQFYPLGALPGVDCRRLLPSSIDEHAAAIYLSTDHTRSMRTVVRRLTRWNWVEVDMTERVHASR